MSSALPLELFGLVAEYLVALDLEGTCAALNATSSSVREETTPILWRRVVFRWKNGQSSKKKSAGKWRVVFESEAARYIQYLIVLPSSLPHLDYASSPWEPPFLSAILARPDNRLKATLIPGHSSVICISLFEHYQPCAKNLPHLMNGERIVRNAVQKETPYSRLLIRPYIKGTIPSDLATGVSKTDIRHLYEQNPMPRLSPRGNPVPPLYFRFMIPPKAKMSEEYLIRVLIDVLTWYRIPILLCCTEETNPRQERYPPEAIALQFDGCKYDQALTISRVLNEGFAGFWEYAAAQISICTRDPLTPWKARHLTRLMQRNYLDASCAFWEKIPGTIYIKDDSPKQADDGREYDCMMTFGHTKPGPAHFLGLREFYIAPGIPVTHEKLHRTPRDAEDGDESEEEDLSSRVTIEDLDHEARQRDPWRGRGYFGAERRQEIGQRIRGARTN